MSVCLSVPPFICPHGKTRLPFDRFSWKFSNFRKSVDKIQVSLKSDKNKGDFPGRPIYIFNHTSLSVFRLRNMSQNVCRENQTTNLMFGNFFFFRKSCVVWDNRGKCPTVGQATDDNIIGGMRIACWLPKTSDTQNMYYFFLFPLQQCLLEHASVLRYKYMVRFFCHKLKQTGD
jgi:hypothetical protein